ncbi:MAG: hypothetical protein AAB343_00475 [Patescibacteria group bacterium]
MLQFQVPQFIEVEDKVIWILSFRQFGIFLAAGGLIFLVRQFRFPTAIFGIFALAIVGFAYMLAFLKAEGRPFHHRVLGFIRYYFSPQLYLWATPKESAREVEQRDQKKAQRIVAAAPVTEKKLTPNKLKELAWKLNIHEQK